MTFVLSCMIIAISAQSLFPWFYHGCTCSDYSTEHTINIWPWGNSPYTWEGKCSFNVPSGVSTWTVNVTFDKAISNFVVYHANTISSTEIWQCLENKFYLNSPYTEHMTFQGDFYGSNTAPSGGCFLYWNQPDVCPYGGTTTTTTTPAPTTTTTTVPTTTTTTTTSAPTTTTTTVPTTTTTTTTPAPTTTTTVPTTITTTTTPAPTTTTTVPTATTTTTTSVPPTTTAPSTTTTTDEYSTLTTTTDAPTTTTRPVTTETTTTLHDDSSTPMDSFLSTFDPTLSEFVTSSIAYDTSIVTNLPSSNTESVKCFCFFVSGSVSDDIFAERMRNLTIDKRAVSSFVRKKISADDDRKSAKNIGVIGCVCLIIVFGLLVSCDIINFLIYMGVLV